MKKIAISRPWLWVAIVGVLVLCLVWFGLGILMFIFGPPQYEFRTVAIYEAPQSGFSIEITGRGIVRSGRDLSDSAEGTAVIRPLEGIPARRVTLTLAGFEWAEFAIEDGQEGGISRSPRDGPDVLARLLRSAGYAAREDEIRETHEVINGVLSGPKGTTLDGQSDILRVVSVTFDG